MSNKKVLVTGGAGFVGSHLVERLVKEGDEVFVIDNFSTGIADNLIAVQSSITTIQKNIEEFSIEKYPELHELDEIYHLAACVGVKKVLEDPLACINTNMHGMMNVLDILMQAQENMRKMPRLFLASTSEVYGKNEKWNLNEDDDRITGSTQKKRWIYAETKAMDEFLASIYVDNFGLDIVTARFFSIVGPRQSSRYGMVLPKFVEQAIKGEAITVYGDGTQIRSLMHVNDCVDSVIKLVRDTDIKQVVNIGNAEPIMIKDLAWRVRHYANSKSEIQFINYTDAYGDGFEDMKRRVPDISKAEKLNILDQKNLKTIDDIIKDTITFYKEGL